ncbi:MAG TPA: bifunctional diaminohydroxyphosphoribosylaminopyrimidine deaminase/5-amino-6-(5-phosphoribosylamino)uracil reductase RibD [Allocoleopsis sp.]
MKNEPSLPHRSKQDLDQDQFDRDQFDREMMQRCIGLAQQALGQTSPNPLVGAVIVQDGMIIGEGYHPKVGQPHAEIFALRDATARSQAASNDRIKGATIYVNLEPCSHHGRTPPCADALIAAGVARVVLGMVDPNPQVAGRGIAKLREAGIEVVVGVEAAACEALNEAFTYRMQHQRPLGILKYAMTLDGKIAATTGHSAWVTSPEARSLVHQLRASCDAVIIGGNTVRRDNPLLTSHGQGHNPLRVVMSRTLDLPREAKLWQTQEAATIVFTTVGTQTEVQQNLKQQGVEVIELTALTPSNVMHHLNDRGCLSVLWECGGTLAAEAIADGAVQKVLAFVAPKIIGGAAAPTPVGDLGFTQMTEALQLERVQWRSVGSDLLIEGYLS